MKNLYILILIVAICGSCTKELDQQPISASSTVTFFNTPNDFIQGVNAVYADLAGYPERLFNLSETRSDNMYAISDGGVRDWEGVNSFWNSLSSNLYMPEAWNSNFNGIMRANTVIDQLEKRGSIVTDKVLRARLKSEARFLRAFYYFDLVRWFGKVPVIDHTVSPEVALTIPRSPVSDVYDLIISDLTYAKDSLLTTYIAIDLGRPTINAAKGLLALVYMTRSGATYDVEGPGLGLNEWGLAESLLNEIIATGKYSFLPTTTEIFRYNNEYNKEVVFDLNFIAGQTPILGSHFPAALVPENWFVSKAKPTMGGSDRPISWDLLKKFTASDKRRKPTIHGKYIVNGKVDTLSFYIKYVDSTAVPGNINLRGDWPINFIVQRYTDILLLKAECILNGAPGTQADVDAIVNQVRTRAGLTSITNVTLPQLMNERRLEFAGEGLRWHDLVRSGLITTIIPAWITNEDIRGQMHPFQKEYVIYPLPQAEMDVKVGLYTQNAGYQ
jgi:hypothetical protein